MLASKRAPARGHTSRGRMRLRRRSPQIRDGVGKSVCTVANMHLAAAVRHRGRPAWRALFTTAKTTFNAAQRLSCLTLLYRLAYTLGIASWEILLHRSSLSDHSRH